MSLRLSTNLVPFLLSLIAGALILVGPADAQTRKGDRHIEERFGFELKLPKDWSALPPPSGGAHSRR